MSKAPTPWIPLALILTLFLGYLSWTRPAELFGRYHDDSIYFSSAKALAGGQGYILPSVPGNPAQTKYPVLYPWLLSWMWRWNPSFPANVGLAVGLSAVLACVFLVLAFHLLRSLGLQNGPALGVVFLCAFQPYFRLLSGAVLSDVPFMALSVAAALLADSAMRRNLGALPAVAAGVLAGLAVLTRGFGLAVVAGIAAAAVYRKAYRHAVVFCAIAAPFVLLGHHAADAVPASAEPGWRQTWLFYTSYGDFWQLSVPNAKVLLAMLTFNLQALLEAPSTYCLTPLLGGKGSYAGIMLCITLSVGILSGLVRQARRAEWKPMHFIFLFYAAIALVWNFPIMNRFLILFLPLFFAGLWLEGSHLTSSLVETLRSYRATGERIVAGVLAAALIALAAIAAREYAGWFRPPARLTSSLAQEKDETYTWIRSRTEPSARFIAYEDVALFLHTGRQAMRPIVFSTEAFYMKDEKVLERDLARFTDVARHIGARYWVASEDDFHLETGLPLIEKRADEWKSRFPVVYRSHGNRVQVYDLSSLL